MSEALQCKKCLKNSVNNKKQKQPKKKKSFVLTGQFDELETGSDEAILT